MKVDYSAKEMEALVKKAQLLIAQSQVSESFETLKRLLEVNKDSLEIEFQEYLFLSDSAPDYSDKNQEGYENTKIGSAKD